MVRLILCFLLTTAIFASDALPEKQLVSVEILQSPNHHHPVRTLVWDVSEVKDIFDGSLWDALLAHPFNQERLEFSPNSKIDLALEGLLINFDQEKKFYPSSQCIEKKDLEFVRSKIWQWCSGPTSLTLSPPKAPWVKLCLLGTSVTIVSKLVIQKGKWFWSC